MTKHDAHQPDPLAVEHFDVEADNRDEEVGDRPNTPPSAYVDQAINSDPSGSARAKPMSHQGDRSLAE